MVVDQSLYKPAVSKPCEECKEIFYCPVKIGPKTWERRRFCGPRCANRVRGRGSWMAKARTEAIVLAQPEQAIETKATYLQVKRTLSWDEYCAKLEAFDEAEKALPWWIGDLLVWGEQEFGDKAWSPIGGLVTEATAKNYASVARAFKPADRVPELGISFHIAVAPLYRVAPKLGKLLLQHAVERCWNRYQLAAHVKREQARLESAVEEAAQARALAEPIPDGVVEVVNDAGGEGGLDALALRVEHSINLRGRTNGEYHEIQHPHRSICATCECVEFRGSEVTNDD